MCRRTKVIFSELHKAISRPRSIVFPRLDGCGKCLHALSLKAGWLLFQFDILSRRSIDRSIDPSIDRMHLPLEVRRGTRRRKTAQPLLLPPLSPKVKWKARARIELRSILFVGWYVALKRHAAGGCDGEGDHSRRQSVSHVGPLGTSVKRKGFVGRVDWTRLKKKVRPASPCPTRAKWHSSATCMSDIGLHRPGWLTDTFAWR